MKRTWTPYLGGLGVLLAAIGGAWLWLYLQARDPIASHGQAAPHLEQLRADVLAEPWPEDAQGVADAGAALRAAHMSAEQDKLPALYAESRMRAVLGEARVPATLGEALRQRGTDDANGLHDRFLAAAITLAAEPAGSSWPAWMPRDARESGFHFESAGAWVANQRVKGYQPIIFPVRVHNRSDVPLASLRARLAFVVPEATAKAPRGTGVGCNVALPELAVGATAIVPCEFINPTWSKEAVPRGLEWVAGLRSGRLALAWESRERPDSPLWHLPTGTANAWSARLAEYERLLEADRLQVRRRQHQEEAAWQVLIASVLVALGYVLAGALAALGWRPGVLQSLLGAGIAVGIVLLAATQGTGPFGPAAIGIVGMIVVALVAFGYGVGCLLTIRVSRDD